MTNPTSNIPSSEYHIPVLFHETIEHLNIIPDGIYVIKYSVSPNDVVFVEYNHLRISKALNTYNTILCNLDLAACEPSQVIQQKLESLKMAKMYLDAAKAKVEFCHEANQGMSLYNYAVKLMKKINCKSC